MRKVSILGALVLHACALSSGNMRAGPCDERWRKACGPWLQGLSEYGRSQAYRLRPGDLDDLTGLRKTPADGHFHASEAEHVSRSAPITWPMHCFNGIIRPNRR
jgi:hypothetical protein